MCMRAEISLVLCPAKTHRITSCSRAVSPYAAATIGSTVLARAGPMTPLMPWA